MLFDSFSIGIIFNLIKFYMFKAILIIKFLGLLQYMFFCNIYSKINDKRLIILIQHFMKILYIFLALILCLRVSAQNKASNIFKQQFINKNTQNVYNYFVSDKGNIVWAGALTLAWKEFNDKIIKQNAVMNTKDKYILRLVNNFNKCPFQKSFLNAKDYYVKSGFGQKTVNTINKELNSKFPKKSTPKLSVNLAPDQFISYAYIFKEFEFEAKFTYYPDFKFNNVNVKGFRSQSQNQLKQIKYYYYQNPKQFLIRINTKKPNQKIYLMRTIRGEEQVDTVIRGIMRKQLTKAINLGKDDLFGMPYVNLDYIRKIDELNGVSFKNKIVRGKKIGQVLQGLKLKIDETGVKVQNEGVMISFHSIGDQPKRFILDGPFWIILKQQGKHPYLCVKINNPTEKQEI